MFGYCSLQASRPAVEQLHLVHLAQRGRGARAPAGTRRNRLRPVRPQLGDHAPPHERLAHRRRVALQLGELGRILGGQGVGDGGDQLRDLHQRALEPAQRLLELGRVAEPSSGRPISRAPAMRAAWTPTVPPTWA